MRWHGLARQEADNSEVGWGMAAVAQFNGYHCVALGVDFQSHRRHADTIIAIHGNINMVAPTIVLTIVLTIVIVAIVDHSSPPQ